MNVSLSSVCLCLIYREANVDEYQKEKFKSAVVCFMVFQDDLQRELVARSRVAAACLQYCSSGTAALRSRKH